MVCRWWIGVRSGLTGCLGAWLLTSGAGAQIVPDATLEKPSVVTPAQFEGGNGLLIEQGTTQGSHLFHSFSDFNVGTGQLVYFDSPAGIQNIFSRVTGNESSDIFGTLGVQGSASLFLLNPNGILFGPDAKLDISGSFVATTAESFEFGDGLRFSATEPGTAPSLLKVNVTPGLQYGAGSSAVLQSQGNLQVGRDLTLGAPRLEVAGQLEAGRDIVLQGQERRLAGADFTVGGYWLTQDLAGEVVDARLPQERLIVAEGDVQLEENYEGPSLFILAGGQVSQAEGVDRITITGTASDVVDATVGDGLGGTQAVTIRAGDEPTVDIRSGVEWVREGGNLNSSGIEVSLSQRSGDGIKLGDFRNESGAVSLRSNGDIEIKAIDSSSRSFRRINDQVFAEDGGNISLDASGNITTAWLFSYSSLRSSEDAIGGSGGNISLNAGGNITTDWIASFSDLFSSGEVVGKSGGNISLNAAGNIVAVKIDSSSFSLGDTLGGDGGEISLNSGINIVTGSIDSSSTVSGDGVGGDGGSISLNAGNNIITDSFESFSSSSSFSDGSVIGGDGGDISLDAGGNVVTNNIDSTSRYFSSSLGDAVAGDGGNISINAANGILIDAINASSSGGLKAGGGGDVSLTAGNDIFTNKIDLFSLSSSFSTSSVEGGNGGNLAINSSGNVSTTSINSSSSSSYLSEFASSADVKGGNGGEIFLRADGDLSIADINSSSSSFLSSARDVEGGSGGDISLIAGGTVSAADINASSSSFSFSESSGNIQGGRGGNISIDADGDINTSEINSSSSSRSSKLGNVVAREGGNVLLQTDGNIKTEDIKSFSFSDSPEISTSSDGGKINLQAPLGAIGTQGEIGQLDSFSASGIGTSGKGGDVNLTAENEIRNLEILTSSSSNQSGKIGITGTGKLLISNLEVSTTKTVNSVTEIPNRPAPIIIQAGVGQQGAAGDVEITGTESLSFTDSTFTSNTNGIDDAGSYTITSPDLITFNNTRINLNTQNQGKAGDLAISAAEILFESNSSISSFTDGPGRAGNITLNASKAITINDSGRLNAQTTDTGSAGNITITTDTFNLDEGTQLTTTATETARPPVNTTEPSANITLNANEMNLFGTVTILSETQGSAQAGNLTLRPNSGNDLTINLANQSKVSASTSGSGRGGTLIMTAPNSITVSGQGTLSAETSGAGVGGDIQITTSKLTLERGVQLSTTAKLPEPKSVEVVKTIDVNSGGPIPASGTSGEALFTFDVPQVQDFITDVDVRLSAAHTYSGDLKITLESSEGTQLELFNGYGFDLGEDIQDTLLDDSATESIVNVSAPFAGRFRLDLEQPEKLSLFNGENATGTWKLIVEDQIEGDRGTLFKAGESAPWGTALGTQLLLTSPEQVDVAPPQPTLNNPNLGRGGTITVSANQVEIRDAKVLAETEGFTKGGDIIFQANADYSSNLAVNLDEQSSISASTTGAGIGGTLSLYAPESISITGKGSLSAGTTGTGTGGDINLMAKTTSVDQASISASTDALGTAGNITLNTETLALRNQSQVRARTTGAGNSGTISLNTITPEVVARFNQQNPDLAPISSSDTLAINLADQSEISVSTAASGQGGNLTLNAPEAIKITGDGTLNAQTSATGSAGNITATTKRLTLDQGTTLSTTATATANPPANEDGSSANITLNADEMDLFGAVEILSETQGNAQAGTLTLQPNTSENLTINLADQSRVSASTSGSGPGGSINLSAPNALTIQGDGTFSAETTGTGTGGNINLAAKNVTIDQATIQTRSAGEGLAGNITANDLTALQMQNGSLILADAGGNADGGNIMIDSDFVFALPGENNDIIANAVGGDGGRITIEADAIFNFELNREPNVDVLRSNSTNDISASSQSGNDGTLNLAGLNADPARGAAQLPVAPAPPNQIDRTCSAQTTSKNDFTITGRGGIPLSPDEPLGQLSVQGQWIPLPRQTSQGPSSELANSVLPEPSGPSSAQRSSSTIQEASQWTRDRQGNVTLLAAKTVTSPHPDC